MWMSLSNTRKPFFAIVTPRFLASGVYSFTPFQIRLVDPLEAVSDVELDHVAVGNGMLAPDVLSVQARFAPDTRVLERVHEVLVHEARDIFDGLAPVQDERTVPVGRTTRRLRVDARDVEMPEQPSTDLSEAEPRRGRDGERGIAEPGHLQERPQLALGVGEAVRFVRQEQRGKPQCEWISLVRSCRLRRLVFALPAIRDDMEMVFDKFPVLRQRRRQFGATLSGGEQQMLAIGRALMARPKLLMLDEPSLGLAPMLVREIFRIIADFKREKRTILLVEQNARKALQCADRGYVLEPARSC
jgi:ABC transporter